MTTELTWQKALRVWRFSVSPEARAGGWPESLTFSNIAKLQYPHEGTDADKSRARRNQSAIETAMNMARTNGALRATEHRQVVKRQPRRRVRSPGLSKQDILWGSGLHQPFMRDARVVPPTPAPVEVEQVWHTVTRADFWGWFEKQREEPSEHIRAWLRPLEQEPAARSEAVTSKFKGEPKQAQQGGLQRQQEQRILEALEELGHDPKKLAKPRPGTPGPKSEVREVIGAAMTDKVFQKAWERLREFRDVQDDC